MARDHNRSAQASYCTDEDRWTERRKAEAQAEADTLQQEYLQKIQDGTYTDADYDAYIKKLTEIQDRFVNDLFQRLRERQSSPE